MIDFRIFYLEQNSGHGIARRKGLQECRNNLVALMDADDINRLNRFEYQLKVFYTNPSLSIVGGQIAEFIGERDNITGIREVPCKDTEIKRYLKKRCPMNQMSVMFKKNEVEKVGGYVDWYCEEDYYLWARMALGECNFYNVPEILVDVRVGDEMSARRGGIKYFLSEAKMQTFLYKKKIIGLALYIYNIMLRFCGEVLVPNKLRVKLFRFFRKQIKEIDYSNQEQKIENQEIDKNKLPQFSVSMCVYGGDNAEWFDKSLESIVNQTVKPQEIVLVVDGPIPDDIQKIINKYEKMCTT